VPVQLGIGLAIGLAAGYATRLLLLRLRLSTAGLYPVLTLGLALLAYGAAALLQGSGFLAVFVAAMVLGNTRIPYRGGLVRIHDALAWLALVAMFLMLGLLVFPSQLLPLAGVGILIAPRTAPSSNCCSAVRRMSEGRLPPPALALRVPHGAAGVTLCESAVRSRARHPEAGPRPAR